MINRLITPTLKRYLKSFPVVLITGARQTGKTTLVQNLLEKSHKYILLENPETRSLAINDPNRFLEQNSFPAIFDEFQLVPELTSYLQGIIDKNRDKKGIFVLTGSQSFSMMEQVTQSLAGRVGILNLYGLSSLELPKADLNSTDENLGKLILRGTYPELWKSKEILPRDWFSSYFQTYLERDVRRLANVGDLSAFERFLIICASRTGQVLNKASIASDSGISTTTAQRWLSILEQSYIIKLVQPYYKNLSSRVRKNPKLYFLDTGLASHLMGFKSPETVINSPQYGAIFETLVYSNFIKKNSSLGDIPEHYYLETKSKIGVDFLIKEENRFNLFEIKGSKTFNSSLCEQLVKTKNELKNEAKTCNLIMASDKETITSVSGVEINIMPWHQM